MSAPSPRTPPHTHIAERCVLGGIMLAGKECFDLIRSILSADDFYSEFHRRVFLACEELAEELQSIDPISVIQRMRRKGLSGDQTCLISEMADSIHAISALPGYARVVKNDALARRAIHAHEEAADFLYSGVISRDQLSESILRLEEISEEIPEDAEEPSGIPDLLADLFRRLERGEEIIGGIGTGLPDVDQHFMGARGGEVYVLAGRPSQGKTSFALQWAHYLATQTQKCVPFFSLETNKKQLVLRLLSNLSRTPLKAFFGTGYQKYAREIFGAVELLKDSKLQIIDDYALTPLSLRQKIKSLQRDKGALGGIFIDYLQLMDADGSPQTENEGIGQVSRALKKYAKEFDLPIIALAQLNRANEKRARGETRPKLSDLRGSGSIEQDADAVIFVHSDDHELPGREIIIAKQKNGPCATFPIAFDGKCVRFGG